MIKITNTKWKKENAKKLMRRINKWKSFSNQQSISNLVPQKRTNPFVNLQIKVEFTILTPKLKPKKIVIHLICQFWVVFKEKRFKLKVKPNKIVDLKSTCLKLIWLKPVLSDLKVIELSNLLIWCKSEYLNTEAKKELHKFLS